MHLGTNHRYFCQELETTEKEGWSNQSEQKWIIYSMTTPLTGQMLPQDAPPKLKKLGWLSLKWPREEQIQISWGCNWKFWATKAKRHWQKKKIGKDSLESRWCLSIREAKHENKPFFTVCSDKIFTQEFNKFTNWIMEMCAGNSILSVMRSLLVQSPVPL